MAPQGFQGSGSPRFRTQRAGAPAGSHCRLPPGLPMDRTPGLSLMPMAAAGSGKGRRTEMVVTLWLLEGLSLMVVAMVASAGGRPREQPPRSEP